MTKEKIKTHVGTIGIIIGAIVLIYFLGAKSTIVHLQKIFEATVIEGAPKYAYELSETKEEVGYPCVGQQFGKLTCESIGLDAPLYYGDGTKELEVGIGVYAGAKLPGQNGTILAGGHDTTFMAPLEKAKQGDKITIEATYGTFTYEVTGTKIAEVTKSEAYPLDATNEQLILYTCYPFGQVEKERTQRYFVYAKRLGESAAKEVR